MRSSTLETVSPYATGHVLGLTPKQTDVVRRMTFVDLYFRCASFGLQRRGSMALPPLLLPHGVGMACTGGCF